MKTLRNIWQRITTTRYTRALEAEIARQHAENSRQRDEANSLRAELARLRAENRALLNSILGIAGIPPILQHGSDTPLPSSLSLPTKCHSESAAADEESAVRSRGCPTLRVFRKVGKRNLSEASPGSSVWLSHAGSCARTCGASGSNWRSSSRPLTSFPRGRTLLPATMKTSEESLAAFQRLRADATQ